MNILIIGSGGRENAFAYKISQSKGCGNLFIMPGNPGTAKQGTNVSIDTNDFKSIGEFCLENKIELLIVGPEEPLVKGMRDYFSSDEKLKTIDDHNKLNKSWTIGINHFTDLSIEERQLYQEGKLKLDMKEIDKNIILKSYNTENIQENIPYKNSFDKNLKLVSTCIYDWSKEGAVTSVKNQGSCNSCGIFGWLVALEGYQFLQTRKLIGLSEQEVLDGYTINIKMK